MSSKILIILIFVFTFISCNSDDEFRDEFNENRQLWASSNINNYSWDERLSCFCGGVLEKVIYVVDSTKDTVVFDESFLFEGYTYIDVFNGSKSVEEAFDYIEELLAKDVASLFIEYDEMYGYPTSISIDYDERIADGGISYFYTNFSKEN